MVAIHQPNFLPYPGFFYKMARSDVFILYDTAQFSKNEWHNRNRIKTPNGLAWLTVPVRSPRFQPIEAVKIDNSQSWQNRLWQTVVANYRRARFFDEYAPPLQKILAEASWPLLRDLNMACVKLVQAALDLDSKVVLASSLAPPRSENPTRKLIEMVGMVGGSTYLCGPGAGAYLDMSQFGTESVPIEIAKMPANSYTQLWGGPFVPGLSILDAILNCGPETRQILFSA